MHRSLMEILVRIVGLLMVIAVTPAEAHSPIPRAQLEQMFANIARGAKWDMSRDMLWGYFFTNPTRGPLDVAAIELSGMGYRVVHVYLSDKKQPADPDLWWLHVERVETHSVESLHQRNAELAAFAARHGLKAYDGMDVGPAKEIGR